MNINGRFEHITTIVFDLDDTLRYNDPHPHHVFCDYAETLGAPLSRGQRREAQRWEHRYWASSEELHKDIETYVEGSEAFWLNYGRRHLLALGISPKEVHLATRSRKGYWRMSANSLVQRALTNC